MSLERTLGEYGARLDNIDKTLGDIKTSVDVLVADKNRAEGSRKVIYTIAGGIGALSSVIVAKASTIFPFLK